MPDVDRFDPVQITKDQLLEQRSRLDVTKAAGLDSTSNALLKIILAADDHISEELLTSTNRCLRGDFADVCVCGVRSERKCLRAPAPVRGRRPFARRRSARVVYKCNQHKKIALP